MKTILLPTDFSDNAMNAVNYAIDLFGADAQYILLNGYQVHQAGATMLTSIDDILQRETEQELAEMKAEILAARDSENLNVECEAINGGAYSSVQTVCDQRDIDIIVMGTKGATGLQEVFWGSNTATVVKKTGLPVLVVPENAKNTGLSKIAYATDYDKLHDSHVLEPMINVAKAGGAAVLVFSVHGEGEAIKPEQAAEGIKLDHNLESVDHMFLEVDGDDTVSGIEKFIKEHNVDMLAMVARQHSFFDQFVNKSMTNVMTMHTDIPLLVMQDK